MYLEILVNDDLEIQLRMSQDLDKLSLEELQQTQKMLEEYFKKLDLEYKLEDIPLEFEQHITEDQLKTSITNHIDEFNTVRR